MLKKFHQKWEEIKAKEKGETIEETKLLSYKLNRYSRQLPPLMASMKMSKKAASFGFEWDNIEGVWDKFHEELAEFEEALNSDDKQHQEEELGDLLFTIVNIARWYQLDPTQALQKTNKKFTSRVSKMEKFAPRPLRDYSLEELDQFWNQAKKILKGEK